MQENRSSSPFEFACPVCHTPLADQPDTERRCPADGQVYKLVDGIWRFLSPERLAHFQEFITEYQTVRREEGRGGESADFYRSLPYRDTSGRFQRDWQIRARSFETFLREVLQPKEKIQGRLRILDLGAGNGWLSNRLAQRGHSLLAVDLLTNPEDGLGAFFNYETPFTPVQAEYDRLPLSLDQADLIVFNASLHYAESYEKTLEEALRVLVPGGRIVILDSPVYKDPTSGVKMVAEREAFFTRKYGFPANSLPSEHYLTFERLQALEKVLGIRWEIFRPYYGLRWSLKPIYARVRARREAARFLVIRGRRVADA